jgi:hypothetical protein
MHSERVLDYEKNKTHMHIKTENKQEIVFSLPLISLDIPCFSCFLQVLHKFVLPNLLVNRIMLTSYPNISKDDFIKTLHNMFSAINAGTKKFETEDVNNDNEINDFCTYSSFESLVVELLILVLLILVLKHRCWSDKKFSSTD